MNDWVPILLTGIASGALGSVITTYGTQTRERRQARAEVREAIRQVQNLALYKLTHERLTAALDNLESSAMLARLPKKLTSLNRQALYMRWQTITGMTEADPPHDPEIAGDRSARAFTADHIAAETIQLLIDATWHPTLSAPRRWWRTRRLFRVMGIHPQPGPRPRDKYRWERTVIRKAKQERENRRRGV